MSDRHVRAPRSLEAKPEGLAGGRSPAGTVAPADVAIVRRCSISFHDGFRRKARKANVSRRSTPKPNPKKNPRLFGSSLLTDARLSVPLLFFFFVAGKKTVVRLARIDAPVGLRARAFPATKKSPRAVSSGSCARVRSRDAAFVGPQSETRLYWSVGKRGLTILVSVRRRLETARRLVSVFFSPSSTRKKTQTRSAAAPRRALCRDDNTRGCLLVG